MTTPSKKREKIGITPRKIWKGGSKEATRGEKFKHRPEQKTSQFRQLGEAKKTERLKRNGGGEKGEDPCELRRATPPRCLNITKKAVRGKQHEGLGEKVREGNPIGGEKGGVQLFQASRERMIRHIHKGEEQCLIVGGASLYDEKKNARCTSKRKKCPWASLGKAGTASGENYTVAQLRKKGGKTKEKDLIVREDR